MNRYADLVRRLGKEIKVMRLNGIDLERPWENCSEFDSPFKVWGHRAALYPTGFIDGYALALNEMLDIVAQLMNEYATDSLEEFVLRRLGGFILYKQGAFDEYLIKEGAMGSQVAFCRTRGVLGVPGASQQSDASRRANPPVPPPLTVAVGFGTPRPSAQDAGSSVKN